jgi:spore maturation protein CgeB
LAPLARRATRAIVATMLNADLPPPAMPRSPHPAASAPSCVDEGGKHPRPLRQQALGALEESRRLSPLWRAAKGVLKTPLLLTAYRKRLEWEQQRAFDALVRGSRAEVAYSESSTRARLAAVSGQRRSLYGPDGRPHVVAFGFENWERFGLWSSMSRTCNLHFIELGALSREAGAKHRSETARLKLARACLRELDALDRDSTVGGAFFYIDSESLSPALFQGLRDRGIWSVVMGLDDKHRLAPRWEHGMWVGASTLLPHVDLYWTTWRTGAQIIQNLGGTPWYGTPAADPSFHYPIPAERDIDVLFLGKRYGERGALVRFLRARGVRVHTAGPGWTHGFVSFEESLRLFGRARVVLGSGATGCMPDVTGMKGRDFEAPMCGTVYATTYNPELADCYVIGQEILCYANVRDCSELIQWILTQPARQAAIRLAARARALRDHTWERRFETLFSLFPP